MSFDIPLDLSVSVYRWLGKEDLCGLPLGDLGLKQDSSYISVKDSCFEALEVPLPISLC